MAKWMFSDELQLAEVNVPRAALQISRAVAYPELNVATYMGILHELSEEATRHLDENAPVTEQAEQLSGYLFNTLGFCGNPEEYNDPKNSFLNDVLERRKGIPITLSIVYIDIATRLGLPAFGIGLPGHFIVGIKDQDADVWLDPYHGGRRLDLTDCAEVIQLATGYEGPLDAGWFAPYPSRAILARILSNLRSSYVASGNWINATEVIQLLRQVQPGEVEHLRDLGLVHYHRRHLPKAAHYLNAYLQHNPDATDAQLIREGIKNILDEWVPMN